MFALVDVNSFYASCEAVFRPDLWVRPVVVLSNNDGCVIARNVQAQAIGVSMAAPYFKQRALFERHNVAVFSSNYALYADMSHRVMSILEEMAPATEIYSIDEAFLDVRGIASYQSLESFGHQVQQRIRQEAHLQVGVGIGRTKTLAKLANYAAKRWKSTGGVLDISSPERQHNALAYIPVEEVWGVGRRLSKQLRAMDINTARDLAECPAWLIRKHFSVVLERTVRELRGESCLAMEEFVPAKQQIICSRSFGYRVTEYEDMRQAVCSYAERAAQKLREEHQFCRQVSVFIRTSPHAIDEEYYANQALSVLPTPTNDTRDIIKMAVTALDRIWRSNCRYLKAGVMLSDFYSLGVAQLNLFDEYTPWANSAALMSVIDEVHKQGKGKLWFAGQGIQKSWAMKREMLSPAYTTRYRDIRVVK
ncbi:translesion error-prone DNA polymerase V subunit UmuC [Atlantibacter subterranea]|uniref:Translesion error-prone DNA polymerase V subunit UmuC n=1 Tax=Atlantibacter subterraneus TaxID=255519 RepID=A0ABU4E486_9ENTR|nr:translesion error-prone DNA polymerase V subunit UmuC [Atlantibacter subterranea]MDV7023940.1 translesion error-prone DNA polymerase V subunit UmuC [Atlantibacter subterranea]MDZ5667076.1 translesion error-prone DNA polymerase V subunit UmuC [Atlantibacter hermannii]